VVNGDIYVCGGQTDKKGNGSATTEILNVNTKTWSRGPDMPTERRGCTSVGFMDFLVVIGGCNNDFEHLKTVHLFDTIRKEWIDLQSMTQARYGCAAAIVNNNLFVVGGFDGNVILKSTEFLPLPVEEISCSLRCCYYNFVPCWGRPQVDPNGNFD